MEPQFRVTGGPADGATVTENVLRAQVGVMPSQQPGTVGAVVLVLGYPQMKVECLLDPDMAAQVGASMTQASKEAARQASGIVVPDLRKMNGFDPRGGKRD